MLRKCGGLPLAISALGGILRNKDPLTEWETVSHKFGIHMSGNGEILSVLALNYDDLPSYLKPCFLYMGCFREDKEIDVMHLYQLWMAEGLIPSSKHGPGESLMDAASDVLDELISRHMVQQQVRNVFTDKKYCKLHDLVRELCVTKGKEEQFPKIQIRDEKVHTEVKCSIGIENSTNDTYCRALIFNNHTGFIRSYLKCKRLRSLVLDHCEFKDNKLPKEIRDMIHLRYLSLENTLNGGILPTFIGDLQYLQTLNLANNSYLELPNIFQKMKRLRCLYLPYTRRRYKNGKRLEFRGLKELEIVEGFDGEYDEVSHVSELVNLRRLSARIWEYEDLNAILVQLSYLLKVQYISIKYYSYSQDSGSEYSSLTIKKLLLCRHLLKLELYALIKQFPRYEPQFCPDLVSLELNKTKFEEDPMPFLQELRNLRDLVITHNAYLGKVMHCNSKAFPKLTSLSISDLHNIEIWRVDIGAFPNLSALVRDAVKHLSLITQLRWYYVN